MAPDALYVTEPTPNPTLTLFACHPKGSAARRYVVFAELARA